MKANENDQQTGVQHTYLPWVDTTRGIGVLLVIIGHMLYGSPDFDPLNQFIYSFHVPLFFVISGYVHTRNENKSVRCLIWLKAKRLLVPAVIFMLMCVPLLMLDDSPLSGINLLRRLSYFDGEILYNLPVWYFFVLFNVYLLIFALEKLGGGGYLSVFMYWHIPGRVYDISGENILTIRNG